MSGLYVLIHHCNNNVCYHHDIDDHDYHSYHNTKFDLSICVYAKVIIKLKRVIKLSYSIFDPPHHVSAWTLFLI